MRIRRIQRRLPRLNIRLLRPHPPRPLHHLPNEKEGREDRNAGIGRDEIIQLKGLGGARERVEAVEEGDEGEEGEGEVRRVGLKGGFEDEGVARDALRVQGAVELDVGD